MDASDSSVDYGIVLNGEIWMLMDNEKMMFY